MFDDGKLPLFATRTINDVMTAVDTMECRSSKHRECYARYANHVSICEAICTHVIQINTSVYSACNTRIGA